MAAGGPGDHPLTDVLNFKLDVYNNNCDELIRQISKFISMNDMYNLCDWFAYAKQHNLIEFEAFLRLKLNEQKNYAKINGWEN